MGDKIKNIKHNNPVMLPEDNYEIEIIKPFNIEMPNTGALTKKSKFTIVSKFKEGKKSTTMIDCVTLKKVLVKNNKYPKLKKNEYATICQIMEHDDVIVVWGDILKIKKVK